MASSHLPLATFLFRRGRGRGNRERKHIGNLPTGCTGTVRTRREIRVFDQALLQANKLILDVTASMRL